MTAVALAGVLARCWTRKTSFEPVSWSPGNPAWGQCAVTALIVQDLLGGTLLAGQVGGTRHYWNLLPKRKEIDLTRHQFHEAGSSKPPTEVSREFVLSFPSTRERYLHLRALVLAELKRRDPDIVNPRSGPGAGRPAR